MNLFLQEIKRSYKAPLIIFVLAAIITFGLKSRVSIFESSIIFEILIFVLPAAVAITSFVVSKKYGNSKVFGRSYFLLGCGFVALFLGEFLYFAYWNILDASILDMFDYLFMVSTGFTIAHIVINIRYFAERIELYQKVLVTTVPVFIVVLYCVLVFVSGHETDDYFFFNLLFVSSSAVTLGLVIVGFTLFRHTVMISAWFLLLVGFFVTTLGDLEYRYYNTLGGDYLTNNSTVLWISSLMILVYALYKHQKAI